MHSISLLSFIKCLHSKGFKTTQNSKMFSSGITDHLFIYLFITKSLSWKQTAVDLYNLQSRSLWTNFSPKYHCKQGWYRHTVVQLWCRVHQISAGDSWNIVLQLRLVRFCKIMNGVSFVEKSNALFCIFVSSDKHAEHFLFFFAFSQVKLKDLRHKTHISVRLAAQIV